MTYKPASGSSDPDVAPGKGLRGPDKQQDEARVQRTQDTDGPPASPAPVATDNVPGRLNERSRTCAAGRGCARSDRRRQ